MAGRQEPPLLNIQNLENTESEEKGISSFSLDYLGSSLVDRRYTPVTIQWVVREVLQVRSNEPRRITFLIKNDKITIIGEEVGELLGNFDYNSIVKLPRLKSQAKILAFVVAGLIESDQCCCHLFGCGTQETKSIILQELKTKIIAAQAKGNQENSPPRKSLHPAPAVKMTHRRNLSYGGSVPQSEDDFVQRFSVFYVGKVTISQAKAPPKFVDDMLRQFKLLEVQDKRCKKNGHHHERSPDKVTGNSKHSSSGRIIDLHGNDHQAENSNDQTRMRSASDGDKRLPTTLPGKENHVHLDEKHKIVEMNDDVSSRVVTFQISMSSLMLFSAGNKQLLLEKKIREISYCTKGQQRADHFGFICREKKNHVLYLFQGESEQMVDMIMRAVRQAFNDALQASAHLNLCEGCPIQSLNKLCAQIEAATLSEQQAAVQEHIQSLNETEYHLVKNQFNASQPDGEDDKISHFVYLLRSIYDQRQKVHKHNFPGMGLNIQTSSHSFDEIKDRSRSTLFEKAKKSLTSSFDNLMQRRQRAKTCLPADVPLLVDTASNGKVTGDNKRCLSPNLPRAFSDEHVNERQRSRTFNSCPPTPDYQSASQTRFVIPESDAETKPEGNCQAGNELSNKNETGQNVGVKKKNVARQGSWRQHIYNTVNVEVSINEEKKDDSGALARARWRKAIMEQILLIRMEKENQNLETKISATETRRQKLSYEVYEQCSADAAKTWDCLLSKDWKEKVDDHALLAAVKAGVPKYRRGEVWKFLVEQHSIRAPSKDEDPRNSLHFEELLEQPTTHQHAILIDIGRTFPAHMYFNGQLGAGQISLFNILKSYSLLDDEVGYCQGLSFVAGMLLMHMPERDAFELFRHAMFNLGIRSQYKPDMKAVQQQLYQLSRLLHDVHPNIYEHFNTHDVTPTLYAAPWFLTLFASHYPIGFVVRVMDEFAFGLIVNNNTQGKELLALGCVEGIVIYEGTITITAEFLKMIECAWAFPPLIQNLIFLQGLEVVFKIALVLFANCSTDILECDGFETIIEYMKAGLPETVKSKGQELITKALDMDITYQLNLYAVEYQLLHEEEIDVRQNRERYEKLEGANRELTQQVNDLKCELDYAKESAEALRKELLDAREHNCRNTEMMNRENQDLKCRLADLENELRNLKYKAEYRTIGDENGATMSPASSEVDEIMFTGLEKKDSVDGQTNVEKSWELVPSPATVDREMVNTVAEFEESTKSGLSKERNDDLRNPVLVNCKSSSSESYESVDLISFDASSACGINAGLSNVLSSSDESLLDDSAEHRITGKSSIKKKRPALPVIHTTGLLATYKDPELASEQ